MNALAITVDGDRIPIRPDDEHEYVLETALAAKGYGVGPELIRQHKRRHADELIEGKHWVVTNSNTPGGEQSATFWTKRGIIRLGFFIRSERAKRFRDAAEDLIVRVVSGDAEFWKAKYTVALMFMRTEEILASCQYWQREFAAMPAVISKRCNRGEFA
jgi:hypothetical protein